MNTVMRQERITKHWTQQFVAERVGVTKAAIHDLEIGRRKPSYDVLVKLEDLFQMNHRDLFGAATPDSTKKPDGNQCLTGSSERPTR